MIPAFNNGRHALTITRYNTALRTGYIARKFDIFSSKDRKSEKKFILPTLRFK